MGAESDLNNLQQNQFYAEPATAEANISGTLTEELRVIALEQIHLERKLYKDWDPVPVTRDEEVSKSAAKAMLDAMDKVFDKETKKRKARAE